MFDVIEESLSISSTSESVQIHFLDNIQSSTAVTETEN